VWKIGASGLVADSTGHYDATTYERQVAHGIDGLLLTPLRLICSLGDDARRNT
jgi:hypothetical protein